MTTITVDEAIALVDQLLQDKSMSDIQEQVFCQSWHGKTYVEIANSCGYDSSYIRDVGYRLWQTLSAKLEALGLLNIRAQKNNLQVTMRTYAEFMKSKDIHSPQPVPIFGKRHDWGNAVDTRIFYGRKEELATAADWVIGDRCRLLSIFGMGGIGKTAFVTKLAEQVQEKFELVIWRSLRHAPTPEATLLDLASFLTNQDPLSLPQDLHGLLATIMAVLKKSRCLIVLDNVELILRSGDSNGRYREGYEGYGELLRQVSEVAHQSCLMLTSREKPHQVMAADRSDRSGCPVRSWQLNGLGEAARQMFQPDQAIASETGKLIELYRGNPLALTVVSRSINTMFNGDIQEFLNQEINVLGGIRDLLDEQYLRLSSFEQQVMYWLAIERESTTTDSLHQNIVPMVSRLQILETLTGLCWRSLIEKNHHSYMQQPMVLEYMTERLIDGAYQAVTTRDPEFLMSYALVQHRAEEHIRDAQIRHILQPLTQRLLAHYGSVDVLHRELHGLMESLRDRQTTIGYAQGNMMNLLRSSQSDLTKQFYRFPEQVIPITEIRL